MADNTHYDLICIGGGSGGLAAAKRAAEYGAKVLVIEEKKLGGTCVNVGCVPKKIIWHAAQIADFAHLASEYGFTDMPVQLDWSTFVKKRDAFIEKLNGIYAKGLDKSNVEWISGHASFIDNQTIDVDGTRYHANHIIIATGGHPVIPDNIPGATLGMDSDGFFALQTLPKSIAVVGGGYIAVEIAGALNALGVETHLIIRRERVLKEMDTDVTDLLMDMMEKHGIIIHRECEITQVESTSNDTLAMTLSQSSLPANVLHCTQLLWATGRRPLTGNIGLENTGVELRKHGVVVIDAYQNTTQPGVYAIGDITNQPALTPAAIEAGRQLAERLFNDQKTAKADFTYVPTVIFSHPAIATVGLTESEANTQFGESAVTVYQATFSPLLRALATNKIPTRLKMVCKGPEQTVIGLHLIGDFVDEIIQGFAVAVQMGATKADFDKTLAIHPTTGEELVTMR
ncbi:glutathione-disulfide reductase [Ostreibacterium oceani]|uniref:Glutathione-disulfide reductase n=1 Tax=Ostreibacterium oceani TaxID=2654998 RepID=A0A6N7EZ25_9GAMM|nr:glutathione-disulfide reductase [Ostreibacterium oceani]MPV86417.1 glutathione-disulfide reductase [Ostreibacterium oceani]